MSKICSKCGNLLNKNDQYCSNCSQAVNEPPPFNQSNGQQNYQQPNYAYNQPQQPPSDNVFNSGPSGRSRGVAALLAILLGTVGGHYFYCGKTVAGIICLAVTLITCGFAAFILGIITLIQGILMFTMTQKQFEDKYVTTPNTFPLF